MRIEQLQYLIEIAETGSINLAAKNCYLSQQGLSEAIQKLEKEFGIELLDRSHKGVHLTEQGKLFVEKSRIIMNSIEELKKDFQPTKTNKISSLKGNLKIIVSALPLLNHTMFLSVLASFNKKHPKVNIIIGEKDFFDAVEAVSNEKADIGIIVSAERLLAEQDLNKNDKVNFEKLYSDKVVMCVGKTLPIANRKSISFKNAAKYPIIVYQPNNNEVSDNSWYFNRLKAVGNIKNFIITSNLDIYKETISKGNAIGYSSLSYVETNPSFKSDVSILCINGFSKLTCGWIHKKSREPSEASKEFMAIWKKSCYPSQI